MPYLEPQGLRLRKGSTIIAEHSDGTGSCTIHLEIEVAFPLKDFRMYLENGGPSEKHISLMKITYRDSREGSYIYYIKPEDLERYY